MSATIKPTPVRAIGRWTLVALVINSIIGSGIFGLPSQLAASLGSRSPVAVLLAGFFVGVIIACFAEVASRFTQAGGPYLYARAAFGRFVGIEVGWMLWLSQLSAPAANANLFVIYLAAFWPAVNERLPRVLILTALVGILAVVNYRGVRAGAGLSNLFTVAKLLPLAIVIAGGVVYVSQGRHASPVPAEVAPSAWLKAILVMIFAYGGFESALTPMGEARNPRRDAAVSLFAALISCTVIYSAIQWITIYVLSNAAVSQRPLADIANIVMGKPGALIVSLGALFSFYGYLSAKMLGVPRITFALAEGRDFPRAFAAIHPRFRTPYVSIFVFAGLVWLLALFGNFAWNLTLSAVARLAYYGVTCAALPVLRKRQADSPGFFLPGGRLLAGLGVGICVVLLTQVDLSKSLILVATCGVAFINWWCVRRTENAVATEHKTI